MPRDRSSPLCPPQGTELRRPVTQEEDSRKNAPRPAGFLALVLALGHTLVDDLSDRLRDRGVELHIIGDAASPRTAEEAVFEGLEAATLL